MILYKSEAYKKEEGPALAAAAIRDYCIKKSVPPGEGRAAVVMAAGEHGKPYCVEPKGIHFSVSHSGKIWICAIQQEPIGIDIEAFEKDNEKQLAVSASKERYMKIASRFYTVEERQYADKNGSLGFLSVWVRKEAYAKLKGTGLTEDFRSFSAVSGGSLADRIGSAEFREIKETGRWIGACCSEYLEQIEEVVDMEGRHDG